MLVKDYKPKYISKFSTAEKLEVGKPSFTSSQPLYKVTDKNFIKRFLPIIAFSASLISALGYFLGSTGLFYDFYKDNQIKTYNHEHKKNEDGVKTITTNTKLGKAGMFCTKIAITAAAIANVACGLGEGIPLMALGEASNLGAAPIIETPIGTGLFGIGIASIFAGLALDNTPELKLNELDLMAAKSSAKIKLILKNTADTAKEIGGSILKIIKNSYKWSFWKENILQITPKTVVFSESVNKDGKVILSKMLRHHKNYLMHAASFTLAVGGVGIITASLLDRKKEQKLSLQVEEGGFLFDNLGITKYGLDKLTTGNKVSGTSFAVGGVTNAISQFMGLDNKDGRALQWLGIAGVFLGYTIDRGKHLKKSIKDAKFRPELTRVVREWKLDLSKIIQDKNELKKLLDEIKKGKMITNDKFLKLENIFKTVVGNSEIKPTKEMKKELEKHLGNDVFGKIRTQEVFNAENAKNVLKICTEKVFGNQNPQPINSLA